MEVCFGTGRSENGHVISSSVVVDSRVGDSVSGVVEEDGGEPVGCPPHVGRVDDSVRAEEDEAVGRDEVADLDARRR